MKNILIITYWSYKDALVQTYTLPYVKLIEENLSKNQKIYLVTLEQDSLRMNKSDWEIEKKKLLEHNIHLIRFNYTSFGSLMLLKFPFIFLSLIYVLLTKKISHIHSWCTPAGSIGYLLSIITGKKLIIDSYEPHAEPMVESGTWKKYSLRFKLLFWFEKKQLERATEVITCVSSMREYVKSKFNFNLIDSYSKPACIDFDAFEINKPKSQELIEKYDLRDKTIGVYAGKFGGSYLKDEVFEFIKIAESFWGVGKFKFIILTSNSKLLVQELIVKYKIDVGTIVQLYVSHDEIPKYLKLADFGISPFIPVPSKRYGSPIKNGEYWSMGLPVIITKGISDDSDIIEREKIGYVLQDLSIQEYENACLKISKLLGNDEVRTNIRSIAIKYRNFDIAKNIYQKIYQKEFSFEKNETNNPVRNILILTYWSYKDALIQTYTLPYVKIIRQNLDRKNRIYLFTLEQEFYKMSDEEWAEERKILLKDNIHLIRFRYSRFGFKMILRMGYLLVYLFKLIKSNGISVIHAWCTPAGAIGYILTKFTSCDLIIDSYEPHAESMIENQTWSRYSLKFKFLFWLEKKQSEQANIIIAPTAEMKSYALNKYKVDLNLIYTKPALVDLDFFSRKNCKNEKLLNELNLKGKITCVYAGKFGGIYLDKEVFDFFKVAESYWKDKFRVLILSSHSKEEIDTLRIKSNLPSETIIHRYVPHNEIPDYIGLGDFGITPVKPIPTKRFCTPIKDGEYWALGLPVVITKNISDDSDIIKKYDIGSVIEELDDESYLVAIKDISRLLENNTQTELFNKIRPIATKYRNFEIAENIYKDIYKSR